MDETSYAKGWLRAFMDGEGCVIAKGPERWIDFGNTEQSVIDDAGRFLDLLGIGYTVFRQPRKPPRKEMMRIRIARQVDMLKFITEIGSGIPYKQAAMQRIVEWCNRPNQAYRNRWSDVPPPSEDAIRELRERGLTNAEAAAKFGMHPVTFSQMARRLGLNQPYRKGPEPDPVEVSRAYHEEQLSLVELSERFGYHGNSIIQYMRKHGIPRRRVGRYNRSLGSQELQG